MAATDFNEDLCSSDEDARACVARKLKQRYGIEVVDPDAWESYELEWVLDALQGLMSVAAWRDGAGWRDDTVRLALGTRAGRLVKLIKVAASSCAECDGYWTPDLRPRSPYRATIALSSNALRGGEMGVKGTFIHEFAHLRDYTSLFRLSYGMWWKTGRGRKGAPARTYLGGEWWEAPQEDFAHAVAAAVYPDRTELDGRPFYREMDQIRKDCISRALCTGARSNNVPPPRS